MDVEECNKVTATYSSFDSCLQLRHAVGLKGFSSAQFEQSQLSGNFLCQISTVISESFVGCKNSISIPPSI